MGAVLDLILDLFFPPKCMLCGKLVESIRERVCQDCLLSELPEYEGSDPDVPYYAHAVATFRYEEPISDAIRRYKFQGMEAYAEQFAAWMAVTIRDKLTDRYDLISWAPCSWQRTWSRGYDQSELLAKRLAKELHVEAVRTLRKVKHTPKQSRTANAARRRANVLGVYRAYEPERFIGKRILMIDDVLTTGATLSECGKVLQMAGAGELVCAVLASAHKDKDDQNE